MLSHRIGQRSAHITCTRYGYRKLMKFWHFFSAFIHHPPPPIARCPLAADVLCPLLAAAGAQNDTIPVAYNDQRFDTVGNYIDVVYDYRYSFRWIAILIEVAFIILLRLIVAFATKYLNFQKR